MKYVVSILLVVAVFVGGCFLYLRNDFIKTFSSMGDVHQEVLSTDCKAILAEPDLPEFLRDKNINYFKCKSVKDRGDSNTDDGLDTVVYDYYALNIPVKELESILKDYPHESSYLTSDIYLYMKDSNHFYPEENNILNSFFDKEIRSLDGKEVLTSKFTGLLKGIEIEISYPEVLPKEGNVMVLMRVAKCKV